MNKRILKYILFVVLLLISSLYIKGQNTYYIKYSFSNNQDIKFNKLKLETKFNDSLSLQKAINLTETKLQIAGYIEANIDSTIDRNNTTKLFISLGHQYKWHNLKTNKDEWINLPNINFKSINFDGKYFNYDDLQSLFNNIITSLENNGYPFAKLKLDDISIKNQEISASLIINKGNLITIDTIILKDYNKIKLNYLEQYLNIEIGEVYNEKSIQQIPQQLNRLQFCKPNSKSEIIFSNDKAIIQLSLRERKANNFNGIIGFQPNSTNSSELQITGQLNLKLVNSLQHGETIGIKWESVGNSSQKLRAGFKYPYLFNSPFGVSYSIDLDKLDSSFLNITNTPSILFALNGNNYISTYATFLSSKTLGPPEQINPKYGIIDLHSNSFGIELFINKLDYTLNPRKGILIQANGDIGYKYFDKRSDVNQSIYDSLPIQELKIAAKGIIKWFIPLFTQQTILLGNSSAMIQSETPMKNEFYRIGGFKILRGFDEQSIFANAYSSFSFEYRYLIDQNSYFGTFYDFALVKNNFDNSHWKNYQGFGLGFSFATNVGIFNLAYALGKVESEKILFRNSKIHFGYTALF